MERKRLQRAALRWGGLALVWQLWAALQFVHTFDVVSVELRRQMASFAESMNRFSQLKTPAMKYPWSAVYLVVFGAAVIAIIGWFTITGLREAMAPEPDGPDGDEQR